MSTTNTKYFDAKILLFEQVLNRRSQLSISGQSLKRDSAGFQGSTQNTPLFPAGSFFYDVDLVATK